MVSRQAYRPARAQNSITSVVVAPCAAHRGCGRRHRSRRLGGRDAGGSRIRARSCLRPSDCLRRRRHLRDDGRRSTNTPDHAELPSRAGPRRLPGRSVDCLHNARPGHDGRLLQLEHLGRGGRAAARVDSRTAGPITTRPGQTTVGHSSSRASAYARMTTLRTRSTPSASRPRRSRRWCRPSSATRTAPVRMTWRHGRGGA